MRGVVFLLPVLLFGASAATHAQQAWPVKPIRLIVANSAGSTTDVAGRVFADNLSRMISRPVAVDNRPGGDGLIGAQAVIASPPDGYTLFFASQSTVAIDPHLRKSMPFDPVRDFTPIAVLVDDTGPTGIFAHPSMPFRTLPDMVEYARANPGKLTYAVTVPLFSMLGEWVQRRAGISLIEVPYKSTPQATQDAIGGRVSLYINAYGPLETYLRSGQLRILAATLRQQDMTEVAAIADVFPGFSMLGAIVLLGPAGIPIDVLQRINAAAATVVKDPRFNQQLKPLRWANVEGARTPQGAAEFIRASRERWGRFIQEAGRQPE
jgi:tripartite-type tricarboxylate transporter receptor subunit TctC